MGKIQLLNKSTYKNLRYICLSSFWHRHAFLVIVVWFDVISGKKTRWPPIWPQKWIKLDFWINQLMITCNNSFSGYFVISGDRFIIWGDFMTPTQQALLPGQVVQQAVEVVRLGPLNRTVGCPCKQGFLTLVKMHVKTPLKFWTQSSPQPSCMKGADKGVWCWACKLLSKQRRIVIRGGINWGEVVRPMVVASANCGQDPQWPCTQCGSAVLVMFTACEGHCHCSWGQGFICVVCHPSIFLWIEGRWVFSQVQHTIGQATNVLTTQFDWILCGRWMWS